VAQGEEKMTAIEQALKEAWKAGFIQGLTYSGPDEVPLEWYFEQYMEKVVAELVEEKTMTKPAAWLNKKDWYVTRDDPSEAFDNLADWEPLYPKREWVNLTYDEILHQADLFSMKDVVGMRRFVKTIEAMLKEKNT